MPTSKKPPKTDLDELVLLIDGYRFQLDEFATRTDFALETLRKKVEAMIATNRRKVFK